MLSEENWGLKEFSSTKPLAALLLAKSRSIN